MNAQSESYLTAFQLRRKTARRTGNEYLVGSWGPLKVIVVRSIGEGDVYNVIFQRTDDRQPRPGAKPTRSERARVNEPLALLPALRVLTDPLPF